MCQLICPHLTFHLRIKIFKLKTNNKWGNIHSIPIYSRWFDKITWNNLDILLIKRLKPSKGELAVTCVTTQTRLSINSKSLSLAPSNHVPLFLFPCGATWSSLFFSVPFSVQREATISFEPTSDHIFHFSFCLLLA